MKKQPEKCYWCGKLAKYMANLHESGILNTFQPACESCAAAIRKYKTDGMYPKAEVKEMEE